MFQAAEEAVGGADPADIVSAKYTPLLAPARPHRLKTVSRAQQGGGTAPVERPQRDPAAVPSRCCQVASDAARAVSLPLASSRCWQHLGPAAADSIPLVPPLCHTRPPNSLPQSRMQMSGRQAYQAGDKGAASHGKNNALCNCEDISTWNGGNMHHHNIPCTEHSTAVQDALTHLLRLAAPPGQ